VRLRQVGLTAGISGSVGLICREFQEASKWTCTTSLVGVARDSVHQVIGGDAGAGDYEGTGRMSSAVAGDGLQIGLAGLQ
jgi:hypothetical protein